MKLPFAKLCGILLLILCSLFCMFPAWANEDVVASIEYFYTLDGTLIGKSFNGNRVNFEYDKRGQLLAVKDIHGRDLERYTYDPAGNRLSKTINGVTTTYTYDNANQLVSSTCNGETIHYKYDAAGRLIQAGDKVFRYGDMNKVVEISRNGRVIAQFEYFMDGQLASARYGDKVEEFLWDGLALIQRNGKNYVNEPYVTGGNPVMADDDVLFNDMLGSTLAVNGKPVEMTAFGETTDADAFFTGKPMIPELGYSFLFRDYDPAQGKWTTTDPLGYPDGWNNLAYVNNNVESHIDLYGFRWVLVSDNGIPCDSKETILKGEAYEGPQGMYGYFGTLQKADTITVTYTLVSNTNYGWDQNAPPTVGTIWQTNSVYSCTTTIEEQELARTLVYTWEPWRTLSVQTTVVQNAYTRIFIRKWEE